MEITDEMLQNAPATIGRVKALEERVDRLLDIVSNANAAQGRYLDLIEKLEKRVCKAEDWALKSREDIMGLSKAISILCDGVESHIKGHK